MKVNKFSYKEARLDQQSITKVSLLLFLISSIELIFLEVPRHTSQRSLQNNSFSLTMIYRLRRP